MVCLYVKDMIHVWHYKPIVDEFKSCIMKNFGMSNLVSLHSCCWSRTSWRWNFYLTEKDCNGYFERFNMVNWKMATTPMNVN